MNSNKHVITLLIIAFLATAFGSEAFAQRVTNGSYQTVAYIKSDGTIQDGSYRTLGYIKSDGTIQDSSYRTIGHVKSDGTVQDSSYRTIGHADGIPLKWAAFYFFFRK